MDNKLAANDFSNAILNGVSTALKEMGYEYHFVGLPNNNSTGIEGHFLRKKNCTIDNNPVFFDSNSLAGKVFFKQSIMLFAL